jgi:hypothetical protein
MKLLRISVSDPLWFSSDSTHKAQENRMNGKLSLAVLIALVLIAGQSFSAQKKDGQDASKQKNTNANAPQAQERSPQNTDSLGDSKTSGSGSTTQVFEKGGSKLIVYSDVPGLAPSEFYTIKVRSAATNNEWVGCFANITRSLYSTLPTNAQGTNNSREHYYAYLKDWSHTYANIEMSPDSLVEVEISAKNGFAIKGKNFTAANAHPAHKTSKPTVIDNKVYFTIDDPAQITIDINGQMDETNTGNGYSGPAIHAISLFANPVITKPAIGASGVYLVEAGKPVPADPTQYTTLYFGPGMHDMGRNFKVHSDKSYYIPGDAIVYGTFNNIGVGQVNNVRIYGYGSLCGDKIKHPRYDSGDGGGQAWKTIYADKCTNFRVEGINLVNPPMHSINLNGANAAQKETFCHWVKVITWRCNGDGIGSAHDIQDCFIRTQDDCTYVKGDRKRCVFWTDVNGAVFMLAGMPSDREIVIEDCDVIYPRHCSTQWNGGRVFAKRGPQQAKTGTTKVNVLFKDIRITDHFQTLETFYLSSKDKQGQSGGFSGITFQNITSVKKPTDGDNRIMGHVGGPWSDITFDNVVLGGKKIVKMSDFGVMGPYVTEVKFLNTASTQ